MTQFQKITIIPENKTFEEVMSNGKQYFVPQFQRDYSWEEEQWHELWQDIEEMRNNKKQHFLGYLVLENDENDNKKYEIIDGQQRLTTISLIFIVALKKLKNLINEDIEKDRNEYRLEDFKKRYMGVFDPVRIASDPKLTLNRHNADYFNRMIKALDTVNDSKMSATNRNLQKAFKFFDEKCLNKYQTGEEIAELLTNIGEGLLFIVINVKDDDNAYSIFETLNSRGMHLSTSDLLKNYLLSKLSQSNIYSDDDFDEFEKKWYHVIEQLGERAFTKFLRSQWAISNKLENKNRLYNVLKTNIHSEKITSYIEDLQRDSSIYALLQSPNDENWYENEHSTHHQDIKKSLQSLLIFGVEQPLSVLMAAYNKYDSAMFRDLCQSIEIITIRYNVICKKQANKQETIYNDISNAIYNDGAKLKDIIPLLKDVYPKNEEFIGDFKRKSEKTNKKALYLLKQIETKLSNGKEPSANATLEHVLPEKPFSEWQEHFGIHNYLDCIYKLGNTAILSDKENKLANQRPFSEKKQILKNSGYKINEHIAEYDEWNIDTLSFHQQWLAERAATVWRIPELEDKK